MIRQRQRKTIEEVYGSKFDVPKSQVTTTQQNSGPKTGRIRERDNGYIISAASQNPTAVISRSPNTGRETARRRSGKHSNKIPNEKYVGKEMFATDEGKKSSPYTEKGEKLSNDAPNVCDNKTYRNCKGNPTDDVPQQHHHQHHQHKNNHRSSMHDEDKDDDTDEFFELIRRTVESAMAKPISELLNRNFRELSSKVERFSNELGNTNALLSQLQNEMSNKIGHYGEENSRHFHYLCMKSEYDKLFYQHQALTAKPPNTETFAEIKLSDKRKKSPKPGKRMTKVLQGKESDKTNEVGACPCAGKQCTSPSPEYREPLTASSENISQKSSEMGMREVMDHIQKFCTQMQFNDLKRNPSAESAGRSKPRDIVRAQQLIEINKETFENEDETDGEDGDDWEVSSDGMTPRNKSSNPHNGGSTTRGSTTQRGNSRAADC